jgi:hypothetical protein
LLEAHQFTAGGEQAQLHGLGQGEARSLGGGQGSEGHPVELAIGGEKPLAAAAEVGQQRLEHQMAQLRPVGLGIALVLGGGTQPLVHQGIDYRSGPQRHRGDGGSCGVLTLILQKRSQVVEAHGHIGMIWPKGFFAHSQGAAIKGLCRGVLPL